MQIHIQRGEENLGSFSLEQTTQYFSEGRFQESDLAWHEGLSEWRPLGEVYTELTSRTTASQTLSPGGAAPGGLATADEFPESFAQGRYLTQQLLGQGGMGQVWLVYDEQLERPVALKTLHQRSAADERALRELKEEVQKCLELTHPNIIRIYDLAEPEGEDAFISMEYVSGEDLSQKLKQHSEGRFEWKEIESYSLSLCEALEYAHDQGMVHRDLKPQNLMVSGENELKLADFGIAATATTDGEEEVPRAGTPVYWGPQQAQGMTPAPTDDIYSLGITLYHLLVGEAPFRGTSEPEITRQHIEDEPMPPQKKLEASGRKGKIPGYVSDLILKCLAKKPTERFQRASEVKAWIEAKGDPVAKKQKRMAMVAVASMVLMLVMGALSVWAMMQKREAVKQKTEAETAKEKESDQRKEAVKQKGIAETSLEKARQENYFNVIALAQSKIEELKYRQAREILWATPSEVRNWEWGYLMNLCHLELLTIQVNDADEEYEVGYLPDGSRVIFDNRIYSLAFSADGRKVAAAGGDRRAKIYDARTGKELLVLKGHRWLSYDLQKRTVNSIAFSPDCTAVVTGSQDETAKIWEAQTGKTILTLKHDGELHSVAFSPDSKRVITGQGGRLKIWDLVSRKTHTIKTPGYSAAFSPDGKRVVAGGQSGTAKVCDAVTGEEILTLDHGNTINTAVFSPDGKRVVTGSYWKSAKIWDAATGKEILTLKGYGDEASLHSIAYSPDGKHLASVGSPKDKPSGETKIWDASSGKELITLMGHEGVINSVAFSPNGGRIITGGWDKTAKIWDTGSDTKFRALRGHRYRVLSVAYSPDGKHIATTSWSAPKHTGQLERDPSEVKIWDVKNRRVLRTLNGHSAGVSSIAFSPDGKRMITGGGSSNIPKIWDVESGQELITFEGHTHAVNSVAFSPDGKRVVTASSDKTAKIWNATTGEKILTLNGHAFSVNSVACSPDGRLIATGSKDKNGTVWNAETGERLIGLKGHADRVSSVAFSPDSRLVATGSADNTVKVWDVVSQKVRTLKGHTKGIIEAAFSPDGKRLVSVSVDELKIWDSETGRELLTIKGFFRSVAFSPDGKSLLSGGGEFFGDVRLWRTVDWTLTKDRFSQYQLKHYQDWLQARGQDLSAIAKARTLVEEGDAQAQFELGQHGLNNLPTLGDYRNSAALFYKAAKQGHVQARLELVALWKNADPKIAQDFAEQGDIEAQCILGDRYRFGEHRGGVDQELANIWYKRAAEQGHVESSYELGRLYSARKDFKEANIWYRKAAEQGHQHAQDQIARSYNGDDDLEAYKWFSLAATNGVDLARVNGKTCAKRMTKDQIAKAEAELKEMIEKNPKLIQKK